MGRYIGANCKLCRREGVKLNLKGTRCFTDKCAVEKRAYAPGQHGLRRRKITEYGRRLREKQKLRKIYGIFEAQFHRYFSIADRKSGSTGENFLRMLEQRFDNLVYRLGFAPSRKSARQMVLHGHFKVDGKTQTIPSMLIKTGATVTVKEKSRNITHIKKAIEKAQERGFPVWLDVNPDAFTGQFVRLPTIEEIGIPIEPQLVVEHYSR